MATITLDTSVKGLFPNRPGAETDKKCIVIAELIRQFDKKILPQSTTQKAARKAAQEHLSRFMEREITTLEAVAKGDFLHKLGIDEETIRDYLSCLLTPKSRRTWQTQYSI